MHFVPLTWLAVCALTLAQMAAAAPMEYGTEAGWGHMLLDRSSGSVSIDVVGTNGHTCDVGARLTGPHLDRAEVQSCRFQLQTKAQGRIAVVVEDDARDACREHCGARAWFEGDYLPLAAACTRTGLDRQQGEALRAYRGKRYVVAFQLWSQRLAACEKTMTWAEVWRWRNDAAIAASHAGRAADCRQLSQAVLADVAAVTLQGETEPFTFAPSDAETARPLIAAARHNLTRCNKPR